MGSRLWLNIFRNLMSTIQQKVVGNQKKVVVNKKKVVGNKCKIKKQLLGLRSAFKSHEFNLRYLHIQTIS